MPEQRRSMKQAFTRLELLIVVVAIGVLAAIGTSYLASSQRVALVLARTYPITDVGIVIQALNRSFEDLNIPVLVAEEREGRIETAWIEYDGDEEHGILKVRWKERKRYFVAVRRNISSETIALTIEIQIQEKPPNGDWVDKQLIKDGLTSREVRGGLNERFAHHYSKLKSQQRKRG